MPSCAPSRALCMDCRREGSEECCALFVLASRDLLDVRARCAGLVAKCAPVSQVWDLCFLQLELYCNSLVDGYYWVYLRSVQYGGSSCAALLRMCAQTSPNSISPSLAVRQTAEEELPPTAHLPTAPNQEPERSPPARAMEHPDV